MATTDDENPITLIKRVVGNVTARQVVGALSTDDFQVIAKALASGQLNRVVMPILRSPDPSASANRSAHPIGSILAKLSPRQLRALKTACPREGCPP